MKPIDKIKKAEEKVLKAKKDLNKITKEVQMSCEHPLESIIEAKYFENYFFTTAPFRVCRLCGYAEEGWSCGYWKLGGGVYSGIPYLPRDEALKLVYGGIKSQEELSEVRFDRKPIETLWEK